MPKSDQQFAFSLSQAVRQVALRQNKKIQIVQDELGYALGRDAGGSAIEYWRKGHVPARLEELELLARELTQQNGLVDLMELEKFLTYGDHPHPAEVAANIWTELAPVHAFAAANPLTTPEEHPVFMAGPPITHPRYFFGRERELKRLFNLLNRRPLQNAAIIGPRRSGKTSLLYYVQQITQTPANQLRSGQMASWLAIPGQYRWVFVDFQDSRWGSQERLLRYLLAGLNLPTPNPCNLDGFIDIASHKLQTPAIILFDEIGVALQRYPELDDAFWEGLRALATHQVGGNLAFILAAHESPYQLAQHNGLGSPFFNIFGYTAFLGPLTGSEAQALIASAPVPFPPDDTAWILEQSRCWPMPLQILCRERLITLEEGDSGPAWQEDALRQIAGFASQT